MSDNLLQQNEVVAITDDGGSEIWDEYQLLDKCTPTQSFDESPKI
jgi:hypothetical protein